ncbi:MAG: hypothetical protein WCA10_24755 [Terracidiphilus sp.]
MNKSSRWIWSIISLAAIACTNPLLYAQQQIYYTGRLFGYYRIEKDVHLDTVDKFLNWRRGVKEGWLLGMGDNFGPEFGASIQLDNNCAQVEPIVGEKLPDPPELYYKQDTRYAKSAACDNVTNFLMKAGYRAIVPGREDFIYSSYWLWKTAENVHLANQDEDQRKLIRNDEMRLDFLAANLRFTSSGDGSNKACPLLFSSDPLGKDAITCTAAGTAPESFDWVSRLDSAKTVLVRNAIESAMIDLGTPSQKLDPEQVRATVVKNELSIMVAAWGANCGLDPKFPTDEIKNIENWENVGAFFEHKANGAISSQPEGPCAKYSDATELIRYWTDLKTSVESALKLPKEPQIRDLLITRADADLAQRQLLRNISQEMEGTGYAIAIDGDYRTLIVGVVGKETMSAVSPENLKVCFDEKALRPCTPSTQSKALNVSVFDPVDAVATTVRAAEVAHGPFSKIIVMAQMPLPEAEILGSRIRGKLSNIAKSKHPGQFVDVILSEGQSDYPTPLVTIQDVHPEQMTPIFSAPTVDFTREDPAMAGYVAKLSYDLSSHAYKNELAFEPRFEPQLSGITTASELRRLLPKNADYVVPCLKPRDPSKPTVDCTYQTVLAMLASLERAKPFADVVLLERRDIYLGKIPDGYGGGEADNLYCPNLTDHHKLSDCLLHVALDRVLWKGDYLQRVAITGSDLQKILDTSAAQAAGENDLKMTDLWQQWLVTYGITQSALTNLTKLSTGSDPSWIPADPECRQADQNKSGKILYCINGRPIASDQIYWVVTSDSLAEDNTIYTQLGALDPSNRHATSTFLTKASVRAFQGFRGNYPQFPSNVEAIAFQNNNLQQQRLYQVDFNKLVLSFSNNHALGPTDQVPAQLQGVADSRAAQPHAQDVDLEATLRLVDDHVFFQSAAMGTLTSFVYERSIKGNLTGSPETISYPQNNATFGAFGQYTLRRDPNTRSRALPRDLLVLTPHQFQTQINNGRLFIGFTAKDASGQPIPGQLAVALPMVNSFNDKVGYRHEWGNRLKTSWNLDGGSYAEGGMEYSAQNNILNSITLANGTTQLECTASATIDIGTCFKNAKSTFPIGPSTTVVGHPDARTLHTPGSYWDVHLSRKLDFGKLSQMKNPFILVSDSQGDAYFGRPQDAVLPTQTKYAVTWNSSLNFPVWGNLNVAPTFNVFYYQPQLSSVHEQIRTFAISLRWYFARDQRTPIGDQLDLSGPASADQTKSSGRSK